MKQLDLYLHKVCLLLFLIIAFVTNSADSQTLKYRKMFEERGLGDVVFSAISQDRIGYMWFAVESRGLLKYDGIELTEYYHDRQDSNSLINNFIYSIKADYNNFLWVGTNRGVDVFDPEKEVFIHLHSQESVKRNNINSIAVASDSTVFVGTDYGLFRYRGFRNHKNEIVIKDLRATLPSIFSTLTFYSFITDTQNSDILWIGSDQGLFKFNIKTFNLESIQIPQEIRLDEQIKSLSWLDDKRLLIGTNNGILLYEIENKEYHLITFDTNNVFNNGIVGYRRVLVDSKGLVWFGTMLYGFVTGTVKGEYSSVIKIPDNVTGLSSGSIMDVFEDSNGLVWVAAKYGGLNVYDSRQLTFSENILFGKCKEEIDRLFVQAIAEDENGNFFIGTRSSGLFYYDVKNDQLSQVQFDVPDIGDFRRVESVLIDHEGYLWFSLLKGVYRYNIRTKELKEYPGFKSWTIFEDVNHVIWFGTDIGVLAYDKELDVVDFYKRTSQQLFFQKLKDVGAITQRRNGDIWFATLYNGVGVYNSTKDHIEHIINDDSVMHSLPDNDIRSMVTDANDNIWLGTRMGGLCRYNDHKKSFESFQLKDGIPSNAVYNLVYDKRENLWLGTDNGIASFNIRSGKIENYSREYGLPDSYFEARAGLLTHDGKIMMGVSNGILAFNPDSINVEESSPKLLITTFETNKKVEARNIESDTTLILPYDKNFLDLKFSLFDFRVSASKKYMYKLEGVDKEWVGPINRNYASYPALVPGEYHFLLKGTNHKNIWKVKPIEVTIIIQPPYWMRWYAFVGYTILVVLVGFIVNKILREKARYRKEIENAQLLAQQERELQEAKLSFFTNVSHEFQTPLSLIIAPIEKLSQLIKPGTKEEGYLQLIQKSSKRLYELIEQLLYFRKAQLGKVKLELIKSDVVSFIRDIALPFESFYAQKSIVLNLALPDAEVLCCFDPDKVEKMLSNLLMNAYKYTPVEGSVDVICECEGDENVLIKVCDNGKGMSQEEVEKVFNRFYQVNEKSKGVGIGLDLAAALATVHKGKMECKSELGVGTEFIIYLTLDESNYNTSDFSTSATQLEQYVDRAEIEVDEFSEQLAVEDKRAEANVTAKPLLLVVDDNVDLCQFLKENLQDQYDVLVENNGLDGYKMACEKIPDLIISDVMMPEMDGFEFCNKIKHDLPTCHIPFILLSAKSEMTDKLKAMGGGADDYIGKPFNLNYLLLRVANLLNLTSNVRRQVKEMDHLAIDDTVRISIYDKKFLKKCYDSIQNYISDTDYNVVQLASDVGLSRAQMNRKLKALIGQSPMELIYSVRLDHAANLLSKEGYAVSDVAHMSGFKSPGSFSTVFKKRYAMSPSEYIQDKRGK